MKCAAIPVKIGAHIGSRLGGCSYSNGTCIKTTHLARPGKLIDAKHSHKVHCLLAGNLCGFLQEMIQDFLNAHFSLCCNM